MLNPQTLTKENFSKFGAYVAQPPEQEISASGDYHSYWHDIFAGKFGCDDLVSGLLQIRKQPLEFHTFERHIKYGEIFTCLNGEGVLALVPPGEDPKAEDIEYFAIKPGDCVFLKQGVWHCLPVPTTDEINFVLMIPNPILSDLDFREL